MSDRYAPPPHVIAEWLKHCSCCQVCGDAPCDGVAAGGMCDELECRCQAHDDEFNDGEDFT